MPGMVLSIDSWSGARAARAIFHRGPKFMRGRKPHGFNLLPHSLGSSQGNGGKAWDAPVHIILVSFPRLASEQGHRQCIHIFPRPGLAAT